MPARSWPLRAPACGGATHTLCVCSLRTHSCPRLVAALPAPSTRYLGGEDLLELCAEVDFPPCLMIRRMLEHMLHLSKQVGGCHMLQRTKQTVGGFGKRPQGVQAVRTMEGQQQRSKRSCTALVAPPHIPPSTQCHTPASRHAPRKQRASDILGQFLITQPIKPATRRPPSHHNPAHTGVQRVSDIMKHPELLDSMAAGWLEAPLLARLRSELPRCARADRSYSPACDLAKSCAGDWVGREAVFGVPSLVVRGLWSCRRRRWTNCVSWAVGQGWQCMLPKGCGSPTHLFPVPCPPLANTPPHISRPGV